MDIGRLETLLCELFVDNFKFIDGKYISPINAESAAELFEAAAIKQKEKETELYTSLVKVVEAIGRDGGISQATYDANKYAINSLARDLTKQVWGGMHDIASFCEQEDRKGRKAAPEQVARFPGDAHYKYPQSDHTNIFDTEQKSSSWEGTLFQTDYNVNGNLETFRIFHQGHRNALGIKTVNLMGLVEKIRLYVAEYVNETPKIDFGLKLDKDAYLQRVEQFNAEFGQYLTVKLFGEEGEEKVVVEFKENPEQLAGMFVVLGSKNGIKIESSKGIMTCTVSADVPDYAWADLFLPSHIESPHEKEPFDPVEHKDSPTVILPYLNPTFSISLMKMYISHKENRAN